ncbi:VOC family protein [Leptospira kirschneri]|uniref:VOC family protein n=1 Tax=Leptospira kirschneri TaxID=29507 RepID=UPI0002E0C859|nr:VOC family protein [Leptospira kirschneri]KON76425.1 3-demethylubiquinone-9 3-methyltransferase domain protein [Leptospira kirschneri serovar Mozdok]KPZ77711.1 3-demethylubiquinone-9 3-methyltransferase [Leptospira kirschneri serovar Mozdok]
MQKITPFLMFDNNLGEALKLYASTFSDWKLLSQNQTGDMVMSATFAISGKEILSFNGGPHFKFTPAISFFLSCQTSKEVEKIWASLSQEGIVLMELQEYPFSEKFGWLQDKFGVSWQVHLSKEGNDLVPFLMFVGKQHGKAEEAIRFYTSRFPNSKIKDIQRYAKYQGEKEGTVQRSVFSIAGQDLMAIDSGLDHTFTFSEAYSFFVKCETQAEIDEYWEKLSFQGEKQKCGWVKDQFGVSWQIIPLILGDYLQDKDPKKSQRVLQAMLQMDKIDIAKLKRAYDSN